MSVKASGKMTVMGHLAELRSRLFKSVIAVLITTIVSFVFANQIFAFLTAPLNGTPLIFIDMTEMIGIYMRVCLVIGVAFAMPYLVYQVLAFATPALTRREKNYIYAVLPFIFFMFVAGIVFSYYLMVPAAVTFLANFGSEIATPQIRISSYITVVTRLMLLTGVVFELPVITSFLARMGIIDSRWLASKRKWIIILAFIAGAVITPTPDPINQAIVAVSLIVLYEVSIWLAKLVQKKKPVTEIESAQPTF